MKPILIINELIIDVIIEHTLINPDLECGGYLYGNIINDNNLWKVYVDSCYYEKNRIGKETEYNFSLLYEINAKNYSFQNNLNLIGCYHSHGNYNAIFSDVDRNILEKYWSSNKIVMIYSPSYNKLICDFVTYDKKQLPMQILVLTSNKEIVTIDKYLRKYHKNSKKLIKKR